VAIDCGFSKSFFSRDLSRWNRNRIMSYSTAYSMEIGATHSEESFCICRSGDMRPDFRPRGVRLGCIANDVRAFRFENRDSYLRICRVALRGYVVGQLRHQIKNCVVATESDIFRGG